MNLGAWQLDTVSGGTFQLDGGTMFGVVPKPLWEKFHAPDERNRIPSGTNCVLARNGTHTVLVDTGYGGKLSDRERKIYDIQPGEPLLDNLASLGVAPEEVDTVVLSHLHFDHAGGATRYDEHGELTPTFPKARYVVQQREWEDAMSCASELRGAYPMDNLAPLEEADQLDLIDGDTEILPGLRSRVTGGHTAGHQAFFFLSQKQVAIYLGDLCPMASHTPALWCMAYDTFPLTTRRQKPIVLGEAADQGWLVLWDHDPDMVACRLERDEKREFRVVEPLPTL